MVVCLERLTSSFVEGIGLLPFETLAVFYSVLRVATVSGVTVFVTMFVCLWMMTTASLMSVGLLMGCQSEVFY